jgi:hypothetical protein
LQKWPDPQQAAALLSEAAAELRELTGRVRANREQEFRKIEADFVRAQREAGRNVREKDAAWRIDHIELGVNRATAMVQVSYDLEVVVPWQRVASASDLEKLCDAARKRLDKSSIEDSRLVPLVQEALESCLAEPKREMAPIGDLYREFRLAMVRDELKSGRADKRLVSAELPRWAFLWNLDRYREVAGAGARVQFEPGSQQDTARGLGFTMGGRSSQRDYRTFCYVKRGSA